MARDYRKRILEQAQVYHTPLGEQTDAELLKEFRRLANTEPEGPGKVLINGRQMPFRYSAEDMVWFDFEALCGPPRSHNDCIELARCHQTVFMSDIPIMGGSRDDRTRRFIFLVDEFYDRRVKLVLSAEAPAPPPACRRMPGFRVPAHGKPSDRDADPGLPGASAPGLDRRDFYILFSCLFELSGAR